MVSRSLYLQEVINPQEWKGRRVFIIGGGPSLCNFNDGCLGNETVLGVNKSFMQFRCDMNYAMDLRFHDILYNSMSKDKDELAMVESWANYKGRKVFLVMTPLFKFKPEIVAVKRIKSKCISLDLNAGIYGGSNSGFGALMLAISLRANPIYLLGFDMKTQSEKEKTHWHKGYPKQTARNLQHKLDRFAMLFKEFAPQIKSQGIEVINLGPDSKLDCFPVDRLENVI